jgi:hypothetical protein
MMISRWVATIASAAVVGLAGASPALAQAAMPNSQMNTALAPEVQEKMTLTDAQVKGFFDAAEELRDAGEGASADVSTEPTKFAKGLAMGDESLAIIKKHGFKDTIEFQRVGFNAAMAYNVLQQGGKEAVEKKIAKTEARQKETMDRLRAQLSPDQVKLLEGQVTAAMATARNMQDVPESNVELMKKYGDRMKGLGKK